MDSPESGGGGRPWKLPRGAGAIGARPEYIGGGGGGGGKLGC